MTLGLLRKSLSVPHCFNSFRVKGLTLSSDPFRVDCFMDKNLLLLFYMWISSFPCTICQKKMSFLWCILLGHLSKIRVVAMWVNIWLLYSSPLIYISVSMLVPCCFSYHGLIILLEIGYGNQSSIILFSRDCFDYPWSLVCDF